MLFHFAIGCPLCLPLCPYGSMNPVAVRLENTAGLSAQYRTIDVYDRASPEEWEAIDVNHEPRVAALVSDGSASVQIPQDAAFYSPLSVLFDAPREEQQPSPRVSIINVRDQLLANATRQRMSITGSCT